MWLSAGTRPDSRFPMPDGGNTRPMTQRDDTTQQNQHPQGHDPAAPDDRRGDVNPADNPRPSSPEPDADSVREGEEKLERVKPY
jgi:hypothetical protein